MRRTAIRVPCALVLSMASAGAMAADIEPYLEFEVTKKGSPAEYYTDVNAAAAKQVANYCADSNYTGCEVTKVWYLNSIYIADFNYTNSAGEHWSASADGYRYYTCDNPPSLYVVSGNDSWGPYPNRYMAASPSWGKVVCRYTVDPETGTEHQSDLGAGDCVTRPNVGNPINVGLNNKYQEVIDIAATSGSPLTWSRYYNSGVVGEGKQTLPTPASLGSRWRGTYDRSLALVTTGTEKVIRLQRHTGERLDFTEVDGRYRSVADPRGQLSRNGDGWIYRSPAGETEAYDTTGRLTSIDAGTRHQLRLAYGETLLEVSDLQGRKLVFVYDSAGRVASVSDDSGVAVTYAYSDADATGREADLVSATYADASKHEYLYNESSYLDGAKQPHALTGIRDETGERFATFWYDRDGRAVRSEHAGGADAVQLTRDADGSVAVTGPTKAVHRYRFAEVRGVRRLVGVDQPGGAGCGAANSQIEYDDNGMVSRRTDFDGRVTEYRYDADGNEVERTEAAGTGLARRITTAWDPALRKPVRITWPGREERFSYDTAGNLVGREEWGAIDPALPDAPLTLSRTWRMTYDEEGRLVREEGPRSDKDTMATLFSYTYRDEDSCAGWRPCDYRKGDLWKTANALGHVTEILDYDASGRVLAAIDEQGSVVAYKYSQRGWLTGATERRADGVVARTALTYNARGDVSSVTDADGITLRFDYDAAGRLIKVSNPSGHRLIFQLDAAGNRVVEEGYDAQLLQTQLTRTFDALGRVETETGANNAITRYTYDERGRPTGTTDADGRHDTSSYDALGRLRESIRDIGGMSAKSKASYDLLDQLTAIEDPKGLTTHYLATGLGDVGGIDSPDSGESTDEYDAAGLLARHEGTNGIGSFQVTRDALGRPTVVRYNEEALETRYTYDVGDPHCPLSQLHAVGRLSAVTQGTTKTVYCYDPAGHIVGKNQYWSGTAQGVAYRYSIAGRLQGVELGGGARTTYRYDQDGSVTGVTVEPKGGTKVDLITSIAYRPFDLVQSWRYGNGRELLVDRDTSGRATAWGGVDPGGTRYAIGWTLAGKIDSLVSSDFARRFGYDGLGHLASVADDTSGLPLRSFEHNGSGDRTAKTAHGVRQELDYGIADHHLLKADNEPRYYDAAGNTVAIGLKHLAYDAAGRLASVSESDHELIRYEYDALDQRIARTEPVKRRTALILYDEAGRWLADYDQRQGRRREAVWVGDYLLGLIEDGQVLYVEPDHLGSPRAVIDPVRGVTIWRLRPGDDPFGTAQPDEDPDADGKRFVFDLRFPGQRYDATTGLHYNFYRDYDPGTGRYIQVDPIGLAGGINPYLYVSGAPLTHIDPRGEIAFVPILIGLGAGVAFDYAVEKYRKEHCNCGTSSLGLPANAAVGTAIAGTSALAGKPRGGVAGGGRAGKKTSTLSQLNHAAYRRGLYPISTRHVITKVLRKVPYAGAAIAGYELYDVVSCD